MTDQRKSAFISGSGRNIGRAVALRLAKDGFNVIVNGSSNRDACEAVALEARALGAEALVAVGDVGRRDHVARLADEAFSAFGSVDVLVNNAAVRPSSPFLEMDEAEWERVLAVDLGAAVWLARAFLPGMVERSWGRIISFAGMNAIHGYNGRAHVSVAKHGAWGLTKSLGKEFGPQGVTANITSPGPIRGERDDPEMAAHIRSMEARVPVGRLGELDEVAAVVALLASDAGAFINGQILQVNGGAGDLTARSADGYWRWGFFCR